MLLSAILAAAVATAPPPPPSPRQLFATSFARLQSYPIPPYVVYSTLWRIRQVAIGENAHNNALVEAHRYAIRTSDGMENAADPAKDQKLPPAIVGPQFLGPFAWSLRAATPSATAGGSQMLPDLNGMRTIATIVVIAKSEYAIDLTGIEPIDGHACYHLRTRPLTDPRKRNLRDLWIDTHTYDLWKAHFVGTYTPAPGAESSASDITTYFTPIAKYWVVSRAVWTYSAFAIPPATLNTFDVLADRMTFPASLPDWLFDRAAYNIHEDAHDPDYLAPILNP